MLERLKRLFRRKPPTTQATEPVAVLGDITLGRWTPDMVEDDEGDPYRKAMLANVMNAAEAGEGGVMLGRVDDQGTLHVTKMVVPGEVMEEMKSRLQRLQALGKTSETIGRISAECQGLLRKQRKNSLVLAVGLVALGVAYFTLLICRILPGSSSWCYAYPVLVVLWGLPLCVRSHLIARKARALADEAGQIFEQIQRNFPDTEEDNNGD